MAILSARAVAAVALVALALFASSGSAQTVRCVYSFSPWGQWSTSACGVEGTRLRTQVCNCPATTQNPLPCGPTSDSGLQTVRKLPCTTTTTAAPTTTTPAPVCEYDFTEWSEWSISCGGQASRTRELVCVGDAICGSDPVQFCGEPGTSGLVSYVNQTDCTTTTTTTTTTTAEPVIWHRYALPNTSNLTYARYCLRLVRRGHNFDETVFTTLTSQQQTFATPPSSITVLVSATSINLRTVMPRPWPGNLIALHLYAVDRFGVVYANDLVPVSMVAGTRAELITPDTDRPIVIGRFPNLPSFECFEFVIRFVTEAGYGVPVSASGCTKDAIPNAPLRPQLQNDHATNSTTTIITWQLPERRGGIITGFDAVGNYNETTGDLGRILCTTNNTDDLSFVLPTAIVNSVSNIRIRALSQAGPSQLSAQAVDLRVAPPSPSPGPADSHGKLSTRTWVTIVVCTVVSLLILAIVVAILVRRKIRAAAAEAAAKAAAAAFVLPLPDKWEVPRSDLVIEEAIGAGAFGIVHRGFFKANSSGRFPTSTIAIKRGGENLTAKEKTEFVAEATMMKRVSDPPHPNVIQLYAVCMQSEPLLLCLEYAPNGNLKDYIRARKPQSRTPLSQQQLIKFSLDAARGMCHLVSLSVVHRDLACRNFLVGEPACVKVADFGLSRNVMALTYYRTHSQETMLPVRWLAPESIAVGLFSHEADVYGFGVALWEMFSYGLLPYPNMTNEEASDRILDGVTNEIPPGCPEAMYALMQRCWATKEKRPTFPQLADELEHILAAYPKPTHSHSHSHSHSQIHSSPKRTGSEDAVAKLPRQSSVTSHLINSELEYSLMRSAARSRSLNGSLIQQPQQQQNSILSAGTDSVGAGADSVGAGSGVGDSNGKDGKGSRRQRQLSGVDEGQATSLSSLSSSPSLQQGGAGAVTGAAGGISDSPTDVMPTRAAVPSHSSPALFAAAGRSSMLGSAELLFSSSSSSDESPSSSLISANALTSADYEAVAASTPLASVGRSSASTLAAGSPDRAGAAAASASAGANAQSSPPSKPGSDMRFASLSQPLSYWPPSGPSLAAQQMRLLYPDAGLATTTSTSGSGDGTGSSSGGGSGSGAGSKGASGEVRGGVFVRNAQNSFALLQDEEERQETVSPSPDAAAGSRPESPETELSEESLQKVRGMLDEYFEIKVSSEVKQDIVEDKVKVKVFLLATVTVAMEAADNKLPLLHRLIADLGDLITPAAFEKAMLQAAQQLEDVAVDVPKAIPHYASLAAMGLRLSLLTMPALNGAPFSSFGGDNWLRLIIEVLAALKEQGADPAEHLAKFPQKLEDIANGPVEKRAAFVQDLLARKKLSDMSGLKLQAALDFLDKQPNMDAAAKFFEPHASEPQFTSVLTTAIVKHVTGRSTLSSATVADSKTVEMSLAKDLLQLVKRHVDGKEAEQVKVLCALQQFADGEKYPQGLLHRWFTYCYDFDVVVEDSFLNWKEQHKASSAAAWSQVETFFRSLESSEPEDDRE
eukprot:m.81043 g.81043  ORF g.81043 m.81043 type:complete len:1505 (-) comp14864_c4_seq1:997-5511(-)